MLEAIAAADQDIVERRMGGRRTVFVNDPSLIGEILSRQSECFEKSDTQRFILGKAEGMTTGFGNGLLTSSNAMHKQQHKLIGRLFSRDSLARYTARIVELTERMQAEWQDGQVIDIGSELTRLSIEVIGHTLFSTDFGERLPSIVESVTTLTGAFGRFGRRRVSTTPDADRHRLGVEWLSDQLFALVEERRRHPRAGEPDLIDILLDAQAAQSRPGASADAYVVTDRQIRDDLITMFVTGTENPRNALSWTLYLLGRHADVHTTLVRELRAPHRSDAGSFHGMPETPSLLLAVFNEALRLYPPGYAFGRRPATELEIGPLRLTPETEVVISPYVLHRRTRLFAQPNQFDPGRFSAEAERALPPYAFLPFGAGPRGCIGGAYSLLEGQAVLNVLLRRWNLYRVHAEPIRPELLMTMRPSAPIWMKVGRA
ncbi:MAG TPA: cytochrome P450 [Polyangiaceae bacterium]|nr:cytochrome P450 [Polyangiaceae bacterium]